MKITRTNDSTWSENIKQQNKLFIENSSNKHFFERSAQRRTSPKRSTVVLPSILKTGRASRIDRRLHARISIDASRRVAVAHARRVFAV